MKYLRKWRVVVYARRKDSDEGGNVGEEGETEGGALLPSHSHFCVLLVLLSSYMFSSFKFCSSLILFLLTSCAFKISTLWSQGRLLLSALPSCPMSNAHLLIDWKASRPLTQSALQESYFGEPPGRSGCRMAVRRKRKRTLCPRCLNILMVGYLNYL